MDTGISVLRESEVGEVFTPIEWAGWLLNRGNVFDRWINGATVCDPTAGEGAFALALFDEAQERGIPLTAALLSRLCLIERRSGYLEKFRRVAKQRYNVEIPDTSIHRADVVLDPPQRSFDILVGNPPWGNFSNLPPDYKEMLKPCFIEAGLVPNRKAVLLGSSRTDIAALVLKIVIGRLLRDRGTAHFFVPLSLFTGDDAHVGFRDYEAFGTAFSVTEVYEFNKTRVFDKVKTAYCGASFRKGSEQVFPVPYFREDNQGWQKSEATPLKTSSDQWRVTTGTTRNEEYSIDIHLAADQQPRQGANTCGANDVFIFSGYPSFIDQKYLFPLATKETWGDRNPTPQKWIFLPYEATSGRPLGQAAVRRLRGYKYLESHEKKLRARKGALLNGWMRKGCWWALLGVGPYAFAPYKIIWEAYGKNEFRPIILSHFNGQAWQGNQALHAFVPCWNVTDAKRLLEELRNPGIPTLLKELNGGGKCNWAQPGKIKKILSFDHRAFDQLSLIK